MAYAKKRPVGTQSFTENSVVRVDVPMTEVVEGLTLEFSGSYSVDTAGANSPEGILSLIRNVTVNAVAPQRPAIGRLVDIDGSSLFQLDRYMRKVVQPVQQPAATAGVQKFYMSLPVDFAAFDTDDYRRSLLNTRELTFLQLKVDFGALSDVLASGAASGLTGTLTVYAREYTDAAMKSMPARPVSMVGTVEKAADVSNTRYTIDLKRGYWLRGVGINSFTRTSYAKTPDDGIIQRVRLLVNREIKYDQSWYDLRYQNAYDAQLPADTVGYAYLDLLAPMGSIDQLLDTSVASDVTLEMDIVGKANGFVRLYPQELIPANK